MEPMAGSAAVLEELAHAIADHLRARGVTTPVVVDLPEQRVRVQVAGEKREIFLGNAYKEYAQAAPADRAAIVAKYARLAEGGVVPATSAADWTTRVLPKLSKRSERELLALRYAGQGGVEGLTRGHELGESLVLELALDEPESVRVLTASDLEHARLTEDAAFALATTNLARRSAEPWRVVRPGYLSPWEDYFDGARLALPHLFRALGLRGDPIVTIPNRCAVLVTGSDEPAGLGDLYAATRALLETERPLHPGGLRLDGDRWRALGDEDIDLVRVAPEVLFLSSLQDALDHEVLAPELGPALAARGFGHVAELQTIERDGAPLFTVVAYPPCDVRSALPRADLVMFQTAGGEQVALSWHKAVALVGPRIDGVWPAYFEATRVPTDLELAAAQAR
ncbi:MAG: hypothetical protein M3619_05835 [Myxococcota bacterium]|nr:hypothetical protein [Myxococcota bacterium]